MTAAALRGGVVVLGLAAGGLTVVLSRSVPEEPVDYAHIAVYVAIGWSFIGAGLVAWRRRPENPVGVLLVAAGLIRFTSQIGWWGNGFAELADDLGRNLFLAMVAHVIIVFPTGRVRSRLERETVAAAYALAVFGYVVPNAFDGSWKPNVLLVHASPLAVTVLGDLFNIAAITIALLLAVIVVGRWRTASRPGRRALAPLIWTAPVACTVAAAALAHDQLGLSFSRPVDAALGWGAITTALIPLALLAGLVRSRLHRSVVADLLVRLERSADPSDVRRALAETLGDPSLELAFPTVDGGCVDELGNTIELPAPGEGRAITDLSHDGRIVALFIYDQFLLEEPELVAGATSAARLTLENTRLQAQLRAQLVEVRASRARIVEAGDSERRRLERNLHDGAQQRLLGIRLALSLAHSHVDDAAEVEGLLTEAQQELQGALEDLRALARGIHPALLTDEGLRAALAALARRAAISVDIAAPPGRLPAAVEQAAYYVASEALANVAKHAGASRAAVTVTQSNGTLIVEIIDDGSGGADAANGTGLRGLRDRVEALDGRLDLTSPAGGGTRLCAELPCD